MDSEEALDELLLAYYTEGANNKSQVINTNTFDTYYPMLNEEERRIFALRISTLYMGKTNAQRLADEVAERLIRRRRLKQGREVAEMIDEN